MFTFCSYRSWRLSQWRWWILWLRRWTSSTWEEFKSLKLRGKWRRGIWHFRKWTAATWKELKSYKLGRKWRRGILWFRQWTAPTREESESYDIGGQWYRKLVDVSCNCSIASEVQITIYALSRDGIMSNSCLDLLVFRP